jgi:hypothetical protein
MTSSGWELAGGLAVGLVLSTILVALVTIWRKGRPFAAGDIFRASRLSKGNRLLPTQVLISPTSVVHFTPQWIGRYEHSIHIAHVASVGIDTHIIFSDLLIETTGGASPIHCRGHYKSDAVTMKSLIERYQAAYYAARSQPAAPSAAVTPGPVTPSP